MTYRIAVRPAAGRELELLGPKLRVRVGAAIDALAGAPRPPNVRKLTGARACGGSVSATTGWSITSTTRPAL